MKPIRGPVSISSEVSDVQPSKAEAPIKLMPAWRVTEARDVQPWKPWSGTDVQALGTTNEVKEAQLPKAQSSMSLNSGILIVVKDEQPSKACS